jgi:hypothetical protein
MHEPSKEFLVTLGLLTALSVIVLGSFFVGARWGGGGPDLIFNLHVVDPQGKPIPGARVTFSRAYTSECSGTTDAGGDVSLQKAFVSGGTVRRPFGPFSTTTRVENYSYLDSSMRVEAAGYNTYEAPLASVFGARYVYSKRGTNLSHTVVLSR